MSSENQVKEGLDSCVSSVPSSKREADGRHTAGAGDSADRYGQENIAIPTDDTSNWCYDNRRKLRPKDKLRRQGGADK